MVHHTARGGLVGGGPAYRRGRVGSDIRTRRVTGRVPPVPSKPRANGGRRSRADRGTPGVGHPERSPARARRARRPLKRRSLRHRSQPCPTGRSSPWTHPKRSPLRCDTDNSPNRRASAGDSCTSQVHKPPRSPTPAARTRRTAGSAVDAASGGYSTKPSSFRYAAATALGSCLSSSTRRLSSRIASSVMPSWTDSSVSIVLSPSFVNVAFLMPSVML